MPKYKLTENGNIEVKDGKPTVIGDDGKEYGIDAIGAQNHINTLVADNKGYKEKAATRKSELEKFAGIDDPAKAIEAIQLVSTMDDKHKVDLDNLKGVLNKTWEEKLAAKDTEITGLNSTVYDLKVKDKFTSSEAVKTTVLVPNVAAAYFGKFFNQDGSAKDRSGNPIHSTEKPGELADFEEAITILIDTDPDKKSILKGTGTKGGGSQPGFIDGEHKAEKSSLAKITSGLKKRK